VPSPTSAWTSRRCRRRTWRSPLRDFASAVNTTPITLSSRTGGRVGVTEQPASASGADWQSLAAWDVLTLPAVGLRVGSRPTSCLGARCGFASEPLRPRRSPQDLRQRPRPRHPRCGRTCAASAGARRGIPPKWLSPGAHRRPHVRSSSMARGKSIRQLVMPPAPPCGLLHRRRSMPSCDLPLLCVVLEVQLQGAADYGRTRHVLRARNAP
jgi:hypothetical protein